ncbi:MAG: hypothetical protein Q7T55_09700, partial [Solirubrobacteraceae bacterium]|nr:hypothetical protein [Solirubrobacteraceae bacterium]
MKPSRLFVAALSTTTVLTGANAGGAAAAERFAKPGGSTAADCLTEATACALGKAIADTPTASQPNENVVTALPGDYTPADALAGDSSLLTG